MKIEVGKSYRTRIGDQVTITNNDGNSCYPFDGSNDCSYTPRGSIWERADSPSDDDLIAEWVELAGPDADGWIEWKSGRHPIPLEALISVKYKDGSIDRGYADQFEFDWSDSEPGREVVAYRLAKPAKELPVTMEEDTPASALQSQVAGDHYRSMKIQPVEYIHANGIGFLEGSVIKYVSRWRSKGGVKDLEKAKHFIDLLIELESKNV